ncbi:DUF805 domain-containing protein [Erwinia persicina]|uniref:DUF805 domain-containing protein n=1 Tax=Erwinia persicina TaxID=55211 RepID=A0A3S7S413_9GAMM|nr:DUF805 domain-containing protein [Erwinia persicina]AXU95481.1 DUF805 domain-containing protein [Erwinia persicina]MBD8105430.1 DUF805 domain-containing protein [Erwinia persicina]MBD8208576.1 DUF805 domain-containing protein [Erwinia persicina]MCQ4092667.1 DUF805 domain-containing protein [Erwinia persicina]MCQ4100727.1 DUF805 domain-containing protein [Erwinia persicina]
MTVWQCYLRGWKGYVNFQGRAGRKEFWVFLGINILVSLLLGVLVMSLLALAGSRAAMFYGSMAQSLFSLLFLLPFIAVGIRRMHDINRSGWWFGAIFITSGLFKLLTAILRGFATPETFIYGQMVLSVLLGWVPLVIMIVLCCKKSVVPEPAQA